jgi:ADP-ribosylglycohydrolase/serine/threonine protein phosphatase PrpC
VIPPRLYLSHDAGLDWLMAFEFGRIDDAQPPDCWRGVTERFGFLHDAPGGRVVGFKVKEFSTFEPEDPDAAEIWGEPRFDVPVLGLVNSSAGEVVLAARTFFDGRDSLNRMIFGAATQASGEEAVALWRQCLESGDAMAHFALGYTLFELGRHAEAYRHLRHYTEIAPHGSWNWCWYGYAAEAVGELAEARRAYRRAVELEESGDQETDAGDRLERIVRPAPLVSRPSPPPGDRVVLWGDELPQLGRRRIDAISPRVAAGLTAGAKPKGYVHKDPNEDAVAVIDGAGVTLLVCADGHNGMAATRAAVGAVLTRWVDEVPAPADVSDDDLVALWHAAGQAVIAAGAAAGQPESRATLVVAIVAPGEVRWAAMGDSMLAIVQPYGGVNFLSKRRSHFVGWPMTPEEVAQRLPRGREDLAGNAWVILATDGLTDFVGDVEKTLVRAADASAGASRVVERLIDAACKGGAGDNVAVIAARVPPAQPVTAGESAAPPRASVDDRIRGCFLGGAVGDALGGPVEFDSIDRIRRRFGADGIANFAEAYGRAGAITDDTQMTLFTAEGLIRAYVRAVNKGICHAPGVVDHAYVRWLATQGERSRRWTDRGPDGWLIGVRALHDRRAPGNTCLSALRAPRAGTVDEPLNDSKGCGGVMRIAPVGLLGPQFTGDRFDLGCDVAALTHGHPSGYLAAGALAELVAQLLSGQPLERALDQVESRLVERPRHEETLEALRAGRMLAASGEEPSPEAIAALGEGWVAEEALAISVYCALVARDVEHGLRLAVNHSGDSDSTGAITGNILGALHGTRAIPARWIKQLELREEIEQLIADWIACFGPESTADLESEEWRSRYPGW